jgi:hypothetical protein
MLFEFILLVIATVGVWAAQNHWVTIRYGEDVQERFLEHCNYIPSQKPALLSFETLTSWLEDPRHARDVDGYVVPVLFPWDLGFLTVLGSMLGLGSVLLRSWRPLWKKTPVGSGGYCREPTL